MKPMMLATVALLLFGLSPTAHANQFSDRDALVDLLGAENAALIADAEEALATAEADLAAAQQDLTDAQADLTAAEAEKTTADAAVDTAQQSLTDAEAALTAAQTALANGVSAGLPADEIAALQADVDTTPAARDAAAADLATKQAAADEAAAAVVAAQTAIDDANAAIETQQAKVDTATADLAALQAQAEANEQFVADLSDSQVVALNRSLNNAVHSGLQLHFDLDLLQRIIDEDLDNRGIQALTHALELEARFEQHAARFEAKAEATGNDKFLDKADQMRDRGDALKQKFIDKIDVAEEAAHEAAREAANTAKREERLAVKEARQEAVRDHVKAVQAAH